VLFRSGSTPDRFYIPKVQSFGIVLLVTAKLMKNIEFLLLSQI
jgi:hypothetical protein